MGYRRGVGQYAIVASKANQTCNDCLYIIISNVMNDTEKCTIDLPMDQGVTGYTGKSNLL